MKKLTLSRADVKKAQIQLTQERIAQYTQHILDIINEADGYRCMIEKEKEKLLRLTKGK